MELLESVAIRPPLGGRLSIQICHLVHVCSSMHHNCMPIRSVILSEIDIDSTGAWQSRLSLCAYFEVRSPPTSVLAVPRCGQVARSSFVFARTNTSYTYVSSLSRAPSSSK